MTEKPPRYSGTRSIWAISKGSRKARTSGAGSAKGTRADSTRWLHGTVCCQKYSTSWRLSNGSIGRDRVEHLVADTLPSGLKELRQEGDRPSLAMKPFGLRRGASSGMAKSRQHGVLAIEGVKFVRRQYDKGRVVQCRAGKAGFRCMKGVSVGFR